jgi:hypothetical protein
MVAVPPLHYLQQQQQIFCDGRRAGNEVDLSSVWRR